MAKNSKYTICVDRLQLIASTTNPFWNGFAGNMSVPVSIGENITLHPLTTKSNLFFDFGFELESDNEFIARIYCGHNNRLPYKCSNPVKIEMLNNTLYQNAWTDKLNSVLVNLNLQLYNYDYAEIAIDGYNIIEKQKSLMDSKTYHRKQPLSNSTVSRDETTGNITSICSGSRKSDKFISIYNKQPTIEKEGKLYIKDFWQLNGLEIVPNKQIDRAELRLKKNQVKLLTPDLSQLNNPIYLSSFFKKYGGHFLEYIHNDEPKRRKHIIDWKEFKTMKLLKPETNFISNSNFSYRHVIKKLYEEFKSTGLACYHDSYNELANNYNLLSWLNGKIPEWNKKLRLI